MKKKTKLNEATYKKTLGQLIGLYLEDIIGPDSNDSAHQQDDMFEPYFSLNMQMGVDSHIFEETKEALAKLLLDRNNLIHHLLPKLNTSSIESCNALTNKLETQCKKIRAMIRQLKSFVEALRKSKTKLLSILQSPECVEFIINGELPESFTIADEKWQKS